MQKTTLAALGLTTLLMTGCGSDDATTPSGSGGSPGGTGGASSSTVPSDTSAQGMAAFVTAETYNKSPWVSETTEPREARPVSPHGRVRVWFNDVLVASQEAGNGESPTGTPHTEDSMVVKVLYGDGDTIVGHAMMLRTADAWLYYCVGPEGRCSTTDPEATPEDPILGTQTSCATCHGGLVFSQASGPP